MGITSDKTDISAGQPEMSSASYKLKPHLTVTKPWLYAKNPNFRTLIQRGYVMSRGKVCIPSMEMMFAIRDKSWQVSDLLNP